MTTQHLEITGKQSHIMNPDVVTQWAAEESVHAGHSKWFLDRANRGAALLPRVRISWPTELERESMAVGLWMEAYHASLS